MTDVHLRSRLASFVRPLTGDGRGWVLVLVALGWFLTLGMRYLVPAVLPQIKATFGVNNVTAGLAVTVLWASYALMQFPAGVLIDRVGERRLLTVSLAAASLSLVVVAVSPTFLVFLAGAALFGFATGLFGPPRGTVLARTFPANDGAAFGLTLAGGSVGSALLPLLAGVLVGPLGWRPTVALAIPGFVAVAAGTWVVVSERETNAESAHVGERVRAIRAAIERRAVVVPVAAITLLLFVLEGLTAFLPTYLIEVKGLSQSLAAGLFALFFVGGAISQFGAGHLADRYGDRVVLLGVTAFSVLPLLALPFVSALLPLAVLVVLMGVRLGVAPISNAYVIAVLPAEVQGTAWGLLRTGFFVLGSTGSVLVGSFADRGRFGVAFLALAALTAVAAGLYVFLPDRRTA